MYGKRVKTEATPTRLKKNMARNHWKKEEGNGITGSYCAHEPFSLSFDDSPLLNRAVSVCAAQTDIEKKPEIMTVGMGLQTALGVEMCNDDDSIMYSSSVSVFPNNMIKVINVFSLSRVIVPNVTENRKLKRVFWSLQSSD